MLKNSLKLFFFVLIVGLAFYLRKQDYAQIPVPGQSTDEYSYSWVGLSLITQGMPIGISGLPNYQHEYKKYINVDRLTQIHRTDPLTINYPWMDHPPLLGLITGGYAYIAGARVFEDASTLLIRRPIILISTFSVALLMIYCWLNINYLTALVGGLIYATVPLVVLSGRMIQAETAIIPMLLLTIIFLSQYFRHRHPLWLVLAAFSSGVATLFKLTGIASYLTVLLGLLYYYRRISVEFLKDFLFYFVIAFSVTFLFFIYGSAYGVGNFLDIFTSNAFRFYGIGPNSITDLITQQRLTQHKFLTEIWIIVGWLVFIGYQIRRPRRFAVNLVSLAIISYLVIYILFGSQPYGWYAFPFWPLLIILLAHSLISLKSPGNYLPAFLLSIMILGSNINRNIGIFDFQPYAPYWRFLVSFVFMVMVLVPIFKLKLNHFSRILILTILLAAVYLNYRYLQTINIDSWWQNIS